MRRILALGVLAGTGACLPRPRTCNFDGTWDSYMVDSQVNNRMGGLVTIAAPSGRVDLRDTTNEGSVQVAQYRIDSLTIRDSTISFQFAPAAVRLSGRCVAPDSIIGTFFDPSWDPATAWTPVDAALQVEVAQ